MKKTLLISLGTAVAVVLLVVLVSYNGFASADAYYPVHEQAAVASSSFTPFIRRSTMQYGSAYIISNPNGPLFAHIAFPIANNFADVPIFAWIHAIYQEAINDLNFLRETDNTTTGTLDIQFDSYLFDNYASIVLRGILDINSTRTNILKTFNLDLVNEIFLETWDIVDYYQAEQILPLITQQMLASNPTMGTFLETVDKTWLENIAISNDGIKIVTDITEVTIPYEKIYFALHINTGIIVVPPIIGIDASLPMVAITFDDGPSIYTAQILDILERYEVPATFFVVGNRVNAYRDTVRRAAYLGSDILGHSWDHSDLTRLSADAVRRQLQDTAAIIESVTGVYPHSFRPTYGRINNTILEVARELDFYMFNWSIDPEDWKYRNAEIIYNSVMATVSHADIILLHDLYASTVAAVELLVPELLAQGFQLVTVSELMYYSGVELEPGRLVRHGNRYVSLNR
ncbi:MAG: polysaccharide deacetylase family protein [Defluviitaleaceae bacterium]|nr:polysaccharide deacetylase family protein [Defluviitaleaceae bacterium]